MTARFPRRFGKYILLDRLSAGGMAEVFRGKVTGIAEFERLVAIKCMLPKLAEDSQFVTMFVDEAKLAAQLTHSNIVQIHELGRLNEQLYIAMQIVHGHDFRHLLKSCEAAGKRMPVPLAAYVISGAASGLEYAHNKIGLDGEPMHLVHRDVSPQNILVGYEGEVKVADFGIAKAAARATETQAGVIKGKFAYMAPEQVVGGEIDQRTDIFSLGIVLYEALTGQRLFSGDSDMAVLERVRNAEYAPIRKVLPDLDAGIAEVVERCLMREPSERFQDAGALADALQPALIEEKSIYSGKNAAEFMAELYADDVARLAEDLQRFAAVKPEDCLEPSDLHHVPLRDYVFESDFAPGGGGALGGARSGGDGAPTAMHAAYTGQSSPGTGAHAGGFGQRVVTNPQATQDIELAPEALAPGLGQSKALIASLAGALLLTLGVVFGLALRGTAPTTPPPSQTTVTPLKILGDAAPSGAVAKGAKGAHGAAGAAATGGAGAHGAAAAAGAGASGTAAKGGGAKAQTAGKPAAGAAEAKAAKPAPAAVVRDEGKTVVRRGDGGKEKGKSARGGKAAAVAAGKRFGFMSVKASGVDAARVYVDGKWVGYSPVVFHKVRVGKRQVKIVEEVKGGGGKSKTVDVQVTPKHNRRAPLKVVVSL